MNHVRQCWGSVATCIQNSSMDFTIEAHRSMRFGLAT